mgnify:FL=1
MGKAAILAEPLQALGRKIFGEVIPDTVQPVLRELSPEDAFTFGKAIDFDPTVREGLDTLMHSAASGSDDAYMLMEYAARDFAQEDATYRGLNKAQLNLAKSQRKTFHTQQQMIDDAPTLSGDKGRAAKAGMQTQFKGPKEYTSGSQYERQGQMITNRHHAIGLDDANDVVVNHQSYQGVTPNSPSPIIQARERLFGIKSGNYEQNMVDVLDSITRPSRSARLLAISEQTGGILDSKTLDDALGMTGSGKKKPYKPRELNPEELARFETLRQEVPDITVEDFMTNMKTSSGRKFTEGSFPDIRVYPPGAKHSGVDKVKAPLEVIKIDTAAKHKNRFNLIFDALDRHGIDTKEARKNFKLKDLEIDSSLDIYGADHPVVHSVINALKDRPGTALNQIKELGPDGLFNLSLDEAIKLDFRAMQEMETVLANVLQYRYSKVKELFVKQHPELGASFFEKLDASKKKEFFKANINTLAVMGNVEKETYAGFWKSNRS